MKYDANVDRSSVATSVIPALLLALIVGLASVASADIATASSNGVVISEFRTRGPAGGNDEFVELLNTSDKPVDISGWQLQGCASSSGSPSSRVTVTQGLPLEPGQHYLFTNSGNAGYSSSVLGDTIYFVGFSDFQPSNLSGARIVDASGAVVDGVGSPNSPCGEGAGLITPTASGDNSFERKSGGTRDTEDNASDFEGPKAGGPQNIGGGGGKPPTPKVTPIHEIQGSGAESPFIGQNVTIEGVVTGVDDEIGASFGSGNSVRTFPEDAGIFVQEENTDTDDDSGTSEGVFVGFVRERGNYRPGDVVKINGEVREKFGQTIVSESFGEEPEKAGSAPVPDPAEVEEARADSQNSESRPYYESLEGMRVRIATGTANSGGTNKFGELFMTLGAERDRVFRTENPPDLIATDADAGAGDPDNPFRDPDGSSTEVRADLFDKVEGAVGPLGFSFGNYKVMVQPGLEPAVSDTGVAYPYGEISPAGRKQLRVASFNVENYFPAGGELDGGTVSQQEFDEKSVRLTDAIEDLLERPDVVAVQEVYDRETLQALADSLGGYDAYLEEGNDSRGIDVGFLIKDGLKVEGVTQFGKTAQAPEGLDCSDVPGGLFDRPPLAAKVQAEGFGSFTVFSNHFSSKAAPDECRQAQAAFVRNRVAELEEGGERVIVAGDLNAFEDESALTTLQDGATTLDNLWDTAPAEERYSFAFSGKLQTLDHALISRALQNCVSDFRYAHFDNDYYEREDPADGHHVSDHDPPVLTLSRGTEKER